MPTADLRVLDLGRKRNSRAGPRVPGGSALRRVFFGALLTGALMVVGLEVWEIAAAALLTAYLGWVFRGNQL